MDKAILLGHQAVVFLNTHTGDAKLVLLPEGVKQYTINLEGLKYTVILTGRDKKGTRKMNKETVCPGPPSETSSKPETVLCFDYKAYTND